MVTPLRAFVPQINNDYDWNQANSTTAIIRTAVLDGFLKLVTKPEEADVVISPVPLMITLKQTFPNNRVTTVEQLSAILKPLIQKRPPPPPPPPSAEDELQDLSDDKETVSDSSDEKESVSDSSDDDETMIKLFLTGGKWRQFGDSVAGAQASLRRWSTSDKFKHLNYVFKFVKTQQGADYVIVSDSTDPKTITLTTSKRTIPILRFSDFILRLKERAKNK
jgi:hypothetical protein